MNGNAAMQKSGRMKKTTRKVIIQYLISMPIVGMPEQNPFVYTPVKSKKYTGCENQKSIELVSYDDNLNGNNIGN